MALIFVQGPYMSAVVLKIHVLPFSCFCIQHQQFICFVSGVVITHCIYCIFFFLLFILQCGETLHVLFCHPALYLEQPSPMQTVISCFLNLAGPSQMLQSLPNCTATAWIISGQCKSKADNVMNHVGIHKIWSIANTSYN